KSYCPKNQIFRPEDLAAFLTTAMYNEYQRLMIGRFLPVVLDEFSVLGANMRRAKIGLLSYCVLLVG
ncbi:MAG: hypothetical protein MJY90_07220, partial [Bacteroidaceae bacterium]|nr:hypothetical protein [Bacteroidaceae bacterium]